MQTIQTQEIVVASVEATQEVQAVVELRDLQLAIVGGGNFNPIFG